MAALSNEDALRADLQKTYGIDLDHAMRGDHTAEHIAALVVYLPSDANIRKSVDKDASWTRQEILLASIQNNLRGLIWGMSDKKARGHEPMPIGPSWMTAEKMRTLPSRAMPIEELLEQLNRPRSNNG